MAARLGSDSGWAFLPADLLVRVFNASDLPDPRHPDEEGCAVLSFEARLRAEAVCKHWRAVLHSEPGTFRSLSISADALPGCGWAPLPYRVAAPNQAVLAKAVARARALVARKPSVMELRLNSNTELTSELQAAYQAALAALLARPGSGRLLYLTMDPNCCALPAYLASLAPVTSLERLSLRAYMACRGSNRIALRPSRAVAALPHLRRLELVIDSVANIVMIQMPMPSLEELVVPDSPQYLAPHVAHYLNVGAVRPEAGRPPSFPALKCMRLAATSLALNPAAFPALQQLSVRLFYPSAMLDPLPPGSLAAVTSLDADISTLSTKAVYDEGGVEEEGLSGRSSTPTNLFLAPLLAAVRPGGLVSLALTLCEPPDGALKAALRAQTRLTHLQLRFDARAGWGPDPAARLDCRLLAGLEALQSLAVDAGSHLQCLSGLARLPELRTLRLGHAGDLPALASHVARITCLQLLASTAAQLYGEHAAACEALHPHLTALRRLVLLEAPTQSWWSAEAAAAKAQAREQALAGLAALLPAECRIEEAAPTKC